MVRRGRGRRSMLQGRNAITFRFLVRERQRKDGSRGCLQKVRCFVAWYFRSLANGCVVWVRFRHKNDDLATSLDITRSSEKSWSLFVLYQMHLNAYLPLPCNNSLPVRDNVSQINSDTYSICLILVRQLKTSQGIFDRSRTIVAPVDNIRRWRISEFHRPCRRS